ncbi:hypothetical protein GCM10010358_72080 [Streptomyces minutiscleroticus]|uniref:Uncharacterized protein n=1 Tax=Streptomyces minutiscleroticus TaxID=68238 RepID=A0A918P0P7_9ACTN|nr:hypothetical protein GCM10010358_72080 [Streptomyces minutiscleroticus]
MSLCDRFALPAGAYRLFCRASPVLLQALTTHGADAVRTVARAFAARSVPSLPDAPGRESPDVRRRGPDAPLAAGPGVSTVTGVLRTGAVRRWDGLIPEGP